MSAKKVYVIETETRKWYVGASKAPKRRIRKHFDGDGAEFLRQEPPRRVVLVTGYRQDWKAVEKNTVLWLAKRFGRKRVRGHSWTSTKPAHVVREVTGYPKYPSQKAIDNLNTAKLPSNIPLYLYI